MTSLLVELSLLDDEGLQAAWAELDDAERRYLSDLLDMRMAWREIARTTEGRSQLPPDEAWWRVFLCRGGRGSGKTKTGAQNFAEMIVESEPGEWALVGPTFGDARDVQMTGPSGLIRALGGEPGPGGTLIKVGPWIEPRGWNVSTGQLRLRNGSIVYCDGADDGALRIQGKNLRGCWCDEIGLWAAGNPKAKTPMWSVAWDESIRYAVRLAPARTIVTGTPKANRSTRVLIKRLLADPKVAKSLLHTEDNADNLSAEQLEEWLSQRGSRLGRQELYGELLDDVEGALVTIDDIDQGRVDPESDAAQALSFRRILVSVDPSFSDAPTADECGIIGGGVATDGHGYILADRSGRMTIDEWSKRAVLLAHDLDANGIVYESNLVGNVVKRALEAAISDLVSNPNAWTRAGVDRPTGWQPPRLIPCQAKLPKEGRLEVVAPLYQQRPPRVHHVGHFDELEEQVTSWTVGQPSPDRQDAAVQLLAELNIQRPRARTRLFGDSLAASSAGQ